MAYGRARGQSLSRVAIYMEGGGSGAGTRSVLRQGMDEFLKELKEKVREKSWKWTLVCCGPRDEAHRRFMNERKNTDSAIVVLLVDAEGPVTSDSRTKHLAARDGWDMEEVEDNAVHLMVQAMETWLVADRDALAKYYGQDFRRNALPNRQNLEKENNADIANALEQATRHTRKGRYHKIRHASDLLKSTNPHTVRARCPSCATMFETLGHLIEKK